MAMLVLPANGQLFDREIPIKINKTPPLVKGN